MSGRRRTDRFDGAAAGRVWIVVAWYHGTAVTWGPYFDAATPKGVHSALLSGRLGGSGFGKPSAVETLYHDVRDWQSNRYNDAKRRTA